jgi:pimeloyl-ACP methyl ester carboxylesterase
LKPRRHVLLAVVKTLSRDKAMISGELVGGWVATYLAAHRPAAVEKLVLDTVAGALRRMVAGRRVRGIALSPGAIGCGGINRGIPHKGLPKGA